MSSRRSKNPYMGSHGQQIYDSEFNSKDYRQFATRQLLTGGDESQYSASQIQTRNQMISTTQNIETVNKGIRNTGFTLDSSYANIESNFENGEITWSLAAANSNNSLISVIAIKMLDGWFPRCLNFTPQETDTFFFREMQVRVAELSNNHGFRRFDSSSYHFSLNIDQLTSQAVRFYPKQDIIIFQSPLNSLDKITLSFSKPPLNKNFRIPRTRYNVRIYTVGFPPTGLHPVTNPALIYIEVLSNQGVLESDILPIGPATPPGIAIFFASATNSSGGNINKQNEQPLTDPNGCYLLESFDPALYGGRYFYSVDENFSASSMSNDMTGSIIVGKNRFAFDVIISELSNLANYLNPVMPLQ